MSLLELLELDLVKQDDLGYRWRLCSPSGRVIDHGVENYLASCLAAAASTLDPASRISVVVDGAAVGCFVAVLMQIDAIEVAAEIAQAVLSKAGEGSSRSRGGLAR